MVENMDENFVETNESAENDAAMNSASELFPSEEINGSGISSLSYHLYDEDVALDVLLDMCKKESVDIKDIFVSKITDQYLSYVSSLQAEEKDYDEICGFLVLAATLLLLKSGSLLPRPPVFEDDDYYEDDEYINQEIFIARVNEYKLLREASEKLGEMERLNRFYREPVFSEDDYKLVIKNFSLDKLVAAFVQMLENAEIREKAAPEKMIPKERFSVSDRMIAIVHILRERGKLTLDELIEEGYSKLEIINTFLAVLELVKKQVTEVMQEEGFGEVYLTHRPDSDKFNFEEDAFTDADGYN